MQGRLLGNSDSKRDVDFTVSAHDRKTGKRLIDMRKARISTLNDSSRRSEQIRAPRKLCFQFDWKLDFEVMHADQVAIYCKDMTSQLPYWSSHVEGSAASSWEIQRLDR